MMNIMKSAAGAVFVLLLTACGNSHHSAEMKADLDAVRAMVAQGSLMTAQAACSDGQARDDLIKGATTLLRRATSGPEMNRIHQMMGQMQGEQSGGGNGGAALSPRQKLHVAVHAAGGDAFDLLDALTRAGPPTCGQVQPVSVAAAAALLRQWHENGRQEVTQKLNQEVDQAAATLAGDVKPAMAPQTPQSVQVLAQALQRI